MRILLGGLLGHSPVAHLVPKASACSTVFGRFAQSSIWKEGFFLWEKIMSIVFLLCSKHIWGTLGKCPSPLRKSDCCPFLTFGEVVQAEINRPGLTWAGYLISAGLLFFIYTRGVMTVNSPMTIKRTNQVIRLKHPLGIGCCAKCLRNRRP